MKICLVSNVYPPSRLGGAEIYVERLARWLALDNEVIVITTEPGRRFRVRREVASHGLVIYRLAPINVAHLSQVEGGLLQKTVYRSVDLVHPQVFLTVRHLLAAERPDLVHVHNWIGLSLSAVLLGAKLRGVPTALTLHDYGLLCVYGSLFHHADGHQCRPDLECRVLTVLSRGMTSGVRLVISPSNFVMEEHRRRGFFGNAIQKRLPYGVEPASFPSKAQQKATFDVLFMGRIQRHKGLSVLIRAFRRLPSDRLRLHIAGTGPLVGDCLQLASGDPRIRFYGFVGGEAKRSLLETADALVLPSLWPDNYPLSIQEAFQAGAVTLASRIGGIPEMINDGVNGLLLPPGDETALAEAIDRLSRSPELAEALRSAAHESVRLDDMADHIPRISAAYRELLF